MSPRTKLRLLGGALAFGMGAGPASAVVIDAGHAVAYQFEFGGGPFSTAGGSISFAVADATPFMALSVAVESELGALGAPGENLTVPGWGVWTWYMPTGLQALQDGSFYVVARTTAGWVAVDLVYASLRTMDGSLVGAQPIAAVPLPVPEPSSLALLAGGLVSVVAVARQRGRAAFARAVGDAEADRSPA